MKPRIAEMNRELVQRVRRSLDESLDERSRVNRRIRRLRNAETALLNGEVPPLLDDLLQRARGTSSTAPSAALGPAPVPAARSFPAPEGQVRRELSAVVGHFGPGLPPSPMSVPQSTQGGVALPQSLDIGQIQRLAPEQLDQLPYGVVTLDTRGKVVGYNDTESRLVGLPRDAVIGRNFFSEVAPCTRIKEFEGRFMEVAASSGALPMTTFDFVFRFAAGDQRVTVLVSPARHRGRFHVSMFRK
ncbi:MAG: PAS domain-containing protein [Myxococcota bacterium]